MLHLQSLPNPNYLFNSFPKFAQNKPCMTVMTTMVPGVTLGESISIAMGMSQHCPAVPVALLVQATAGHIMIKQE